MCPHIPIPFCGCVVNNVCIIFQVGQGNPKHRYRLGSERIESSSVEDFGVLGDKKLNMTQ